MVYLLRHCDYDTSRNILPGRLPVELSPKGIERAKKLRDFFADKHIEKIFSSAVLRCKQTVEIISNEKIPIVYDKRLLEVLAAFQAYWNPDPYLVYWTRHELGGETNIQKRIVDFWKNTYFEDGKNYIICSHGDPLYFLYLYLTRQQLPKELNYGEKTEWPKMYLPMGGIWPVEKKSGEWKVGKIIKI